MELLAQIAPPWHPSPRLPLPDHLLLFYFKVFGAFQCSRTAGMLQDFRYPRKTTEITLLPLKLPLKLPSLAWKARKRKEKKRKGRKKKALHFGHGEMY
jgi:hypothetical protein